jgi:hypothetical protein
MKDILDIISIYFFPKFCHGEKRERTLKFSIAISWDYACLLGFWRLYERFKIRFSSIPQYWYILDTISIY